MQKRTVERADPARASRARTPPPVGPVPAALLSRRRWPPLALLAGILPALAPPAGAQESAEGKTIRRIEIRGLERTPESELLSRLSQDVRVGEPYSREAVDEETRRLYNLGNFLRVYPPEVTDYEDGVAITWTVEEKPFVRRLRFIGNAELSRSKLVGSEPALLTREGDLFNPYWVRQDEQAILEKYLRAGYLFARVEAEEVEGDTGVTVTFRISEGSRVRIREVSFVGNRTIDSDELLDLMTTREKGWFFGLFQPGFYAGRVLEGDLIVLKNHYRQHGFFDVRIEPEEIRLGPEKESLRLTIRVDEGPRYIFRGYRFQNNAVFSDQTLRDITTAQTGRPFNHEQLQRDRQAILKYYGDRAYVFARVDWDPIFDETEPEVTVVLDVQEENEIFIEHIRIEGNRKTQDRVIRRELEFYPGERVDQSKLVKSRSNLARLNLFREIEYSYEGTGSHRDLVVSVDEDTSGRLIVGFGVTSGFGVIGNLNITKRNFDITDWPDSIYEIPDRFTGAGQTLNLVAQPGSERSLYRLTFIEPYLFNTRNALTLSGSSLELIREDWDEDSATFESSVGHSFDFDRDFRVDVGIRLEETDVEDIEADAPSDVVASAGTWSLIAGNTGMSYNKVLFEPLEGPYDGHAESIRYEYAGGVLGGDVDFHKVEVDNSFYFPLYTHEDDNLHHVISFKNHVGVIEGHDDPEFIPVFERYFLGGPQTVRGFSFRGLGPHENGTPFGGTAQLWGNVEYSFPIFMKILRGVVFLDYGNLAGDVGGLDFSDMRYAAGGGVRIMFPFLGGQPLPIGLFFGVPLSQEDGDEDRLFLFTIGTPF